MAYLAFLYFGDLTLVLKARAVTNPFPDLSNFSFDSEDVVSILFRLWNISEISKVTILSLSLISLCSLTLRPPQFSCSQTETNLSYLWTFPPRTSSEWSNHNKQAVVLQLIGTSCWYRDNCITKLWAHRSYFLYLYMVFFQHYLHSEQHFFLFFEHSKLIESSLILNLVYSYRTLVS